ncbi:succinyl-CoA synthetase subunit alpha [Gloeocapsa sp. PCC 73106]|uniref:succinate--CoA ligase subunit alpha n=1 Tax=Gloeocapsa sp. PCC 73106 TaxID=102232 RepID=UPI0002AC57C0|nr:succinyl-CoA synthetase subunit alpha [Gloeocapsa sp. PCC 73106]ELR99634.1 succinyl-CoA synthetase, alpha subunit [Gloeocapsa sp. PCC 73106]
MNWQMSGRILVQGLGETEVLAQVTRMKAYGTPIVAGINPIWEGKLVNEIPIYALVEEAIAQVGEIQTSLIFAHPYAVLDAALEAIAAGIRQLIVFSQEIPPLDVVRLLKIARDTQTVILGPGSGGILIPEKFYLGIWEPQFYQPGNIAILSDSSKMTYEVALSLHRVNLGESIVTSIGTDPILGTSFRDWLEFLNNNPETSAIALVTRSERIDSSTIDYINSNLNKPLIVYAYNRRKHWKNAPYILSNQFSYVKNTLKDILNESDLLLATRPSEIGELLQ